MSVSVDGFMLCTSSNEKSIKVFDVMSFGNFCIDTILSESVYDQI